MEDGQPVRHPEVEDEHDHLVADHRRTAPGAIRSRTRRASTPPGPGRVPTAELSIPSVSQSMRSSAAAALRAVMSSSAPVRPGAAISLAVLDRATASPHAAMLTPPMRLAVTATRRDRDGEMRMDDMQKIVNIIEQHVKMSKLLRCLGYARSGSGGL